MKRSEVMDRPAGLVYDVLHDIRKAMRALRRAEKAIMAEHRAEKRRRKQSAEWQEARRLREQPPPAAAKGKRRVLPQLGAMFTPKQR